MIVCVCVFFWDPPTKNVHQSITVGVDVPYDLNRSLLPPKTVRFKKARAFCTKSRFCS